MSTVLFLWDASLELFGMVLVPLRLDLSPCHLEVKGTVIGALEGV